MNVYSSASNRSYVCPFPSLREGEREEKVIKKRREKSDREIEKGKVSYG